MKDVLLYDTIKIDVINRQPPAVFVDQRKSRTTYPGVGSDFDSLREAAHETGLAGSELADKANDLAALN